MFNSKTLDRPSLVIIIDCWNNLETPECLTVFNNIRQFCSSPFVRAIGLASYINDTKNLPIEEPWWGNSQELFFTQTHWGELKEAWINSNFVAQDVTHPIIRDMPIRKDQRHFGLWKNIQALYYCNYIDPEIENIYILGGTWEICLRFARSVSWVEIDNLNLYNMFNRKINILTRQDCVLTKNYQPLINITPPWNKLDDHNIILDDEYWHTINHTYPAFNDT